MALRSVEELSDEGLPTPRKPTSAMKGTPKASPKAKARGRGKGGGRGRGKPKATPKKHSKPNPSTPMKTPSKASPTPKAKSSPKAGTKINTQSQAQVKAEPKTKGLKRPAASRGTSGASPIKRPATGSSKVKKFCVYFYRYKSNGVWGVKVNNKEAFRVSWQMQMKGA